MRQRHPLNPTLAGKRLYILLLFCLCSFAAGCAAEPAPDGTTAQAAGKAEADDYFGDDDADDKLTKAIDPDVLALDEEDDYFDDDDAAQVLIPDPLEPWNRFWHGFNDGVMEYLARPVVTGYEFITPAFVRKGILNFFTNMKAPGRVINCLLQGKGLEAGVEFSSFVLNTVGGVGGIFDIASGHKTIVPATGEDFGQTLGKWGFGEGVYIVWPFFGPSNVRESIGRIGQIGINFGTSGLTYIDSATWLMGAGVSALDIVSDLRGTVDAYDTFQNMAIDPYSAMRDGYTKIRRAAIAR